MKLLFDFLPILIFFIAYYLGDIYVATASAIGVSVLQVGYLFARGKKPEMMTWVALIMIIVLGGLTLFLHNEMFIKWKPTLVYWVLATAFAASQFKKKSFVQSMLEKGVSLPPRKWQCLNLSWVVFFISMGIINLYVVYHYDTSTWVTYKLVGSLVLTLLFVFAQGLYLMKYNQEEEGQPKP